MYSCKGDHCPLAYRCKRNDRFNDESLSDEPFDPCYDRNNKSCNNYISIRDKVCAECLFYHDEYCDHYQEAGIDDDSIACVEFVACD